MALAAAGTFAWQMAAADARATISMATTHEDGRTQQPPPDGTLGSAHADAVVGRSSDAAHVTAAEADLTQIAEPVPKQGTSTRRIAAHAMPKNRTAPADDSGHSIPPPQGVSTEPATSAGSISGTPPIVKSLPFVNADQLWNSKERLLTALEPWLPWIVGLWTCGVGLLALRLAVGWGIIRNLKRRAKPPRIACGTRGSSGSAYEWASRPPCVCCARQPRQCRWSSAGCGPSCWCRPACLPD